MHSLPTSYKLRSQTTIPASGRRSFLRRVHSSQRYPHVSSGFCGDRQPSTGIEVKMKVFLMPSYVAAESAPIAKLSHERFAHQKRGGVRTNRPQVRKRTDHPFGLIRRRGFFQNRVARRFHLFDQLQDEFKPIEQTFDASARHLWKGIAVRLAQRSQLLASITP